MDNTWETIQVALQEIVLIFMDKVTLNMNVFIENRDEMFGPDEWDTPFLRMWGPNNAEGRRPQDVPQGASIRVRQWGAGFLPVMDETRIDASGFASLEAVKGSSVRSGGTCIELETDYAMMTSDLVPNEVCNFNVGMGGSNFYEDFNGEVLVNTPETFALTQLHDSHMYARTVIGYEPHKVDVLIGAQANNITGIVQKVNGSPSRVASTVCLDFPSTGLSVVVGTGVLLSFLTTSYLPLVSAEILAKDIWWPSAGRGGRSGAYNSRGVMTHEFGHFLMCSMLYDQGGPSALRGTLGYLTETRSVDAQKRMMMETFADTFAMQVVGGSNYVHVDPNQGMTDTLQHWAGTDRAAMGWCTGSAWMDFNYTGTLDTPQFWDPFLDRLTRYEGLVYDAFDRGDSAAHFPPADTAFANEPNNGDVWELAQPGTPIQPFLRPATNGTIRSRDEGVALKGPAWRAWVQNWLKHGRVPNRSNVLRGLADTMASYEANGQTYTTTWCDRCEVFAPHYPTTPFAARMADTTGDRTWDIRAQRWRACIDDGEMHSILGDAPERFGNLEGTTCQACAPLHEPDGNGGCRPCPPNQVPRGAGGCEACPNPTDIALPNNECQSCAFNQIQVGNTCQDCAPGTGADRTSNTCVTCPSDDTVVLENGLGQCSNGRDVSILYSGANQDVCPHEFWLEVSGLQKAASDLGSSSVISFILTPESVLAPQWNLSESECPTALATLTVNDAGSGTEIGSTVATATWDGSGGVFSGCMGSATVNVPVATIRAGADAVRIKASLQGSGEPVGGSIYMQSPDCDDYDI